MNQEENIINRKRRFSEEDSHTGNNNQDSQDRQYKRRNFNQRGNYSNNRNRLSNNRGYRSGLSNRYGNQRSYKLNKNFDEQKEPKDIRFFISKDINKLLEANDDINYSFDNETFLQAIETVATSLDINFDPKDPANSSTLLPIYTCLVERPHKINVLSCLAQVSINMNPNYAKAYADFFQSKINYLFSRIVNKDYTDSLDLTKEPVGSGFLNKIKLILRFIATLTPSIIELSATIGLFHKFINFAVENQNRVDLSQGIIYAVLMAIPHLYVFSEFKASSEVNDNEPVSLSLNDEATKLIQMVDTTYPIPQMLDLYKQAPSSKLLLESLISDFKNIIELESGFSGLVRKLYIDYSSILASKLEPKSFSKICSFNIEFPDFSNLDDNFVTFPNDVDSSIDNLWSQPRLLFNFVSQEADDDDFSTMPRYDKYEGILFKDIIQDITQGLLYNKGLAATQFQYIRRFFHPDLFAKLGINKEEFQLIIDKNQVVDASEKSSTWGVEDLLIQNIMSLSFELPECPSCSVYYPTLLTIICFHNLNGIIWRLGKAFTNLFDLQPHLDLEVKQRFIDWMFFQLNAFQFKWKWGIWYDLSIKLNDSTYNPHKIFFENLITRETQFASYETVFNSFGSFSSEFAKYMNRPYYNSIQIINDHDQKVFSGNAITERTPQVIEACYLNPPLLKFNEDENTPYFKETNEFLTLYQGKDDIPEEQFWDLIQRLGTALETDERIVNKKRFTINLLFQCICFITSGSTTYFRRFIERNLPRFKKFLNFPITETDLAKLKEDSFKEFYLAGNDDAKEFDYERDEWLIESIVRYWNILPYYAFVSLTYLIDLKLITLRGLINFFFKDEDGCCHIITNFQIQKLVFLHLDKGSDDDIKFFLETSFETLEIILKNFENLNSDEELVNVDAFEVTEENEITWKFFDLLSLIKVALRKYRAVAVRMNIKESIDSKVTHGPTKNLLIGYL